MAVSTPHPPPPRDELRTRVVLVTTALLKYLGVAGTVDCRERLTETPPHLWVDITTESSGLLIGERGTNLRAFEHVLRLLLRRGATETFRCVVDVNGYRLRRMELLKRLARAAARRVAASHHAVTLDPMPAMERRIVHLALTGEASVATASVGMEPERRVVIRPRDPFLTPEDRPRVLAATKPPTPPAS